MDPVTVSTLATTALILLKTSAESFTPRQLISRLESETHQNEELVLAAVWQLLDAEAIHFTSEQTLKPTAAPSGDSGADA